MPDPKEIKSPKIEGYDAQAWAFRLNVAMKVAIVVVFAIALFVPLDVLEGKGMGFRAPFFVGVAAIVPMLQRARPRSRQPRCVVARCRIRCVGDLTLSTSGGLIGSFLGIVLLGFARPRAR